MSPARRRWKLWIWITCATTLSVAFGLRGGFSEFVGAAVGCLLVTPLIMHGERWT